MIINIHAAIMKNMLVSENSVAENNIPVEQNIIAVSQVVAHKSWYKK